MVALVSSLSIEIYQEEMAPFSTHPIVQVKQSEGGKDRRRRTQRDFYLMKFPPPISLLYLLVRWSACIVSLDRTPNSPLR